MIKMKGVLAVPGEYTYGDMVEVKTAEELKDAAQRFPIVPLSYGHTIDGFQPPASMQIGTVSQKWSEEQQKVLGEFWLHEERIPENLRKKIDNGEPIPISAGVILDDVDENGIQRGISYTHVAVLDGEDPKCPLGTCGMNVRMESNRKVRLEQSTEIPPPEPKAAEKETEVAPEPIKPNLIDGGYTSEEVDLEAEEPKPETPVEQKPEEPSEQATPKEEVRLEPEVMIPIEAPVVQKPFEVIDGLYQFVPEVFKTQQEKKK
jgi:hypothetical protein